MVPPPRAHSSELVPAPVEGYAYRPNVLVQTLIRLRERRDPLVDRGKVRAYRIDGPDGWTADSAIMPVPPQVERSVPNPELVTAIGTRVLGVDVRIIALSSVNFAVTPPRPGRETTAIVHTGGRVLVLFSDDREGLLRFVERYLAAGG